MSDFHSPVRSASHQAALTLLRARPQRDEGMSMGPNAYAWHCVRVRANLVFAAATWGCTFWDRWRVRNVIWGPNIAGWVLHLVSCGPQKARALTGAQ